ncbi:MAG: acyloxyacyl hydrolase [Lutibacter sp.]|uniref:acyloxyacyl hydrolase n=1 Tax=Lutibacter sp. TaxID=1925666 RepID=UPI00299EF7C2|nr:acyloxyacyl hydrolase [Lutibacter sp.]MDX1828820.1 acyloxyacyl hydrolase [Lutibacter sp.]
MKQIIYIVFLLLSTSIFAQNSSFFKSVESDFFIGKNIEHDKSLHNAIQGNSYGLMVLLNTPNNQKSEFNTLYNYPDKGFSLIYLNYNSSILGEAVGAYRHYAYAIRQNNKFKLKLTTGFGLGYANKPYNAATNSENFALGSHLLVTAFLKLNYFKYFLNKKITLSSGFSLVHFSNIAFKNPNLGINTVSLHFGIKYQNPIINTKPEPLTTVEKSYKWNYNVLVRVGYNESLIIDSGLFPFYTFTFYGSKYLNKYSTLTLGADYFDSKFLKEYIKNEATITGKNYNPNDYSRIGIFIGHELTQNHFAFVSQIGYYAYYPFPYVSRLYERFGFKYKISKHLFSEVTLKANLFRAEGLEIGLGYKF